MTEFQALAGEVAAGRLRMNDDAAGRCAKACATYIDGLSDLKMLGATLVRLESFGSLRSAQQLGQKFFDLAAGGAGSFEEILQQHIDVAMQIQDVFIKAGAAYTAAEQANEQSITAAGSGL